MPSTSVRVAGGRRPAPACVEAVSSDQTFRDGLLAAVPNLRAFAISLTGDVVRADDLVQETLLRALSRQHLFEPGTNLPAWLFTILRNRFHSEYRKRRWEAEDPDDLRAGRIAVRPEQEARLEFDDLRAALMRLPPEQREALLLVGAQGLSYEETAAICGVAIGTVKSRVFRGRARLAELMHLCGTDEVGPDSLTRAAMWVN